MMRKYSNQQTFLERAIRDGHAKFTGEGKQRKIVYLAVNHSERYSDPEEKVRAEFWAELIYHYQYDPQRIGIEITVPDRTPHDRADIVIFHDDERKRPYAVIECKKDGISDAEFEQAVEQAWGNASWAKLRASYVGVVAGSTRRFFDCSDKWGALEREKNIIADLPIRYGKPMEFKYYKGGVTPDGKKALDIQPVSREELISAIQKSHQTLWGGGRLSPPAAFGELSKVLFVKIADEKKPRKKGQPYAFQIKTNESSRQLASRIRALYDEEQKKDPDVFTDTIKIDDATLRTLVSHLESININETDLDTKGIAFEQFMDGFFKGGFGQYFTPRPIIEFAVEMMQPTHEDIVLDPACGSGGFLLYALDAVRAEAREYYPDEPAKKYRHWHDFAQHNLFGIEINEEIARVAKMNMIVHDDGHSNVIGADALDRIERLYEINRGFLRDHFTLVLTNPPFGAEVKKSERHYLGDYDLGKKTDKKGKTTIRPKQKTEILYLERIWHFLVPGEGRAAVVVPDGILTNSSLQYVRDWLLEHFQLLAVVSLPQTAFTHYGAGVKSSIIFLRKRAEDETPADDEAIFMAAPEYIGYDATGRKTENQLPEIAQKYREFLEDPTPFFA